MLVGPSFRAERCVRYRYSYSECSRCADACPHEAIRLFDAGVEVLERCQSCALCAAICPTEALAEKSVSAESLLKIAANEKQMTIACAPSDVKGDAIVPCLGAINPVILADFSRRGIELQLAGAEHCAQCAHAARGPDLIQLHLAAREILCSAGSGGEWAALILQDAESRKSLKKDGGHDAARRSLFRRFIGSGIDQVMSEVADAPPAPLKAIRAAAPFLPGRKEILNALYVEHGDAPVRVARHPALPAEDLRIIPGCTYCEACIRVCPTGALQLLENNSAWRVIFLNERCVACDVCSEVCQPEVLRQGDAEDVFANKQKARVLIGLPKRRCSRCDRVFMSIGDSSTCPICSGDEDDFASIFG